MQRSAENDFKEYENEKGDKIIMTTKEIEEKVKKVTKLIREFQADEKAMKELDGWMKSLN